MNAIALSSIVVGWVSLGLLMRVIATVVARRGDGRASRPLLSAPCIAILGNLLPPLTIGVILLWVVLPVTRFGPIDASRGLLWVHRVAVGGLGSFVLLGQYFQIEARMKAQRGHGALSLERTYRRLHLVTALMPAPAALLILGSGLTLMYHGKHSLSAGWLFYLVSFFAFFFIDGLTHYLPYTKTLLRLARDAIPAPERMPALSAVMHHRASHLLMLFHYLSFPGVVSLGYYKPDVPHPLGETILALEQHVSLSSIGILREYGQLILAGGWIAVILVTVVLWRVSMPRRRHPQAPGIPVP
jgi:hypothetical protein